MRCLITSIHHIGSIRRRILRVSRITGCNRRLSRWWLWMQLLREQGWLLLWTIWLVGGTMNRSIPRSSTHDFATSEITSAAFVIRKRRWIRHSSDFLLSGSASGFSSRNCQCPTTIKRPCDYKKGVPKLDWIGSISIFKRERRPQVVVIMTMMVKSSSERIVESERAGWKLVRSGTTVIIREIRNSPARLSWIFLPLLATVATLVVVCSDLRSTL